jgi:hypothetical protein
MSFARAALFVALFMPSQEGTIRGRVHYPACFAPEDLRVCAEPIDETGQREARCVAPTIRKEEITYELSVTPGEWIVYAKADESVPGHRAYYTHAVSCGLRVECSDHTPIAIRVSKGEIVDGVDPDDWWAIESPLHAYLGDRAALLRTAAVHQER